MASLLVPSPSEKGMVQHTSVWENSQKKKFLSIKGVENRFRLNYLEFFFI